MLGVGDEKVGPKLWNRKFTDSEVFDWLPLDFPCSWIFSWIPLDFPNLVPFGFLKNSGLGKTSQFDRAWRGQCGCPEQEWLHSSPGSFS